MLIISVKSYKYGLYNELSIASILDVETEVSPLHYLRISHLMDNEGSVHLLQ